MVLTVAHQLPERFGRALAELIPQDIRWISLPPETAYEVPDDVQILLATVPRAGNIVLPPAAPPGWPGPIQWVQTVSTGVDEFPRWVFDVPLVTCGRGANSEPISEYVLAALLTAEKQLLDIWISDPKDWHPRDLGTLQGKTLGLLGFGSIAQAVAKRALPFGMRILAQRRSEAPSELQGVEIAPLDKVLREADHLVVTLPLTEQTYHLLDRQHFALMKPTAHLVNISRGGIVDQGALLAALDDGKLAFATLDVTEPEPLPEGHPLYRHPKVRLSPHLSWSGGDRSAFIRIFRENLDRFIRGDDLLNRVYPDRGY